MESYVVGSKFWLTIENHCYSAVVTETKDGHVTFTTGNGKVFTFPRQSVTTEMAMPMHQSSIDGVEDMARLGDLHEAAILYNLQLRYASNDIYTHIGSILVALNPYQSIEGMYTEEKVRSYNGKYLGDLPPHINAVSNEAYYAMWRKGGHQCILISGESGAGKTESTKHILRYLSQMSKHALQKSNVKANNNIEVEEAIIQSSPILEAFGNAKTVYNNNSSRFGKFMELNFSDNGNITGGVIVDYLLEKNRVVSQNPAERNFHIFYSLCAGIAPENKSKYHLYNPDQYHYLNQSGCISDPTINDKRDYQDVISAMYVLGLSEDQVENIHFVLSSILQLGNINFITTGGAQVEDRSVLENLSNLLQVDLYQLNDALTIKRMVLRGEEIFTPLTIEQAVDSRDSIAMALYRACFKWLIHKINIRLRGAKNFYSIGVLDIFGFENFKVNRFEQFNINFANEKLQEYFNKHIFSLEQLEYQREGLQWSDIDWNDNGECLDLVEKKIGLLSLIDEESHFPKGTDVSLLRKLHENHSNNPFYIKPRVADTRFGIRHYAGEVFYDTHGFLAKNRDTFREDLLTTLKESRSEFIYDLFDTLTKMEVKPKPSGRAAASKKPKKPTVSSQFKDSLFSLMTKLNNANPYFVRCIKPNSEKVAGVFETDLVLNQLKYSGMLETVKIRKAGFPVRRTYEDFLDRYKVLFYKLNQRMLVDAKDNCIILLQQFDAKKELHCLGKTKIFMKDKLEADIEIQRNKNRNLAGQIIIKVIMGYIKRKKYLHIRNGIIAIQKVYRGHYYHMKYIRIQRAVIMIQKFERGRKARKLYAEMLEQKRIEEEKRREEERRREEEHQRELERLEQERRLQELEELKRKKEEEERIRMQLEEEKRIKEEQQRQAELAKLRELEELKRAEEERRRIEEEAKRLEEEKRIKEEEEIRLREEEEERKRIEEQRVIEQEEEDRVYKEATEAALSQMAELEKQLMMEEERDEEDDFDEDSISGMSLTDEEESDTGSAMDGYLYLKGGLMSTPKKHWCILKDDSLMWFRAKQKSLKSGWMTKKGGGTGTFARRNWKRRWFVLKDTILTYHDSDQEGARVLGTIDLRECKEIQESGQKDNAISIVLEERTYHIITENYQDWNDWYGILNRVYRANEEELKQMKDEAANIKNAVGTIDTILMESITIELFDDKTNGFSIITANRVYSFTADTTIEISNWVDALHKSKDTQLEEGHTVSIEKGWLIKRGAGTGDVGKGDKKRWFTVSANSLDYFKSSEKNAPKLGSIVLQSLCTVTPPPAAEDVKSKEAGQWEFAVDGRKRSYHLVTPTYEEAIKWYTAIKEVIDNKTPVQTVYQKLMEDIMGSNSEAYIDRIYRVNPLLNNTNQPLRMPLLPLPYGYCLAQRAQGKSYGNFYDEAVRMFTSLLELEKVADYMAVIQGILQTCHDMKELRDEIYCQLIKQTTGLDDPNNECGIRYMQVLVCMCCTFLPQRKVLRFLRFHLKRLRDQVPESEIAKFADFALDSLKKTRVREFPPSRQEIVTLLGRRKIQATVHCYGEGSCQITIDSSTTSGEVVDTLCKGMKIKQDNLIFALFERCGPAKEYSIEDRQIVADILSKFEQYKKIEKKKGRYQWQLFFRIFCFINPARVKEDSIEGQFLYEQTCEHIQRGRYLLPEMTLCKLAALRLQYLEGDHVVGSWIDKEINTIYPVLKLKKKARLENKAPPKKDFGTFKGTISNIKKAMAQYKAEEELSEQPKYDIDEELSAIKSSIMTNWKTLQSTPTEHAQVQYMSIVKNWHGFGSTMFYVTSKDPTMPAELSLGVSFKNVAFYKRDETRPLASYNYEDITQFGAKANTYRIAVQNRNPIFVETDKTIEISKLMKAYINEIVKISRRKSMQLRNSMDYDEMT